MDLDITGSLIQETAPLSAEAFGSALGGLTGSSAIDTVVGSLAFLPLDLVGFIASVFRDLGSTTGAV